MSDPIKYLLPENEIPRHWYNLVPDLSHPPPPPVNPATGEPATPDDFAAIFPAPIIEQEMSAEREIEIPSEVREIYKQWRPSPLFRARR